MDSSKLNNLVQMADKFEKLAQLNSRSGLVMDILNAAKLAYQQGKDVLPSWLRPDLEKVRSAVRVFYGAAHAGNTRPQELFKFLGNITNTSNALAARIKQNEDNPYADQTAMTASQIMVPYLQALNQSVGILASNPAMHQGIGGPAQVTEFPQIRMDKITPSPRPAPTDLARVQPKG